jgi:hypothetical protein
MSLSTYQHLLSRPNNSVVTTRVSFSGNLFSKARFTYSHAICSQHEVPCLRICSKRQTNNAPALLCQFVLRDNQTIHMSCSANLFQKTNKQHPCPCLHTGICPQNETAVGLQHACPSLRSCSQKRGSLSLTPDVHNTRFLVCDFILKNKQTTPLSLPANMS